jgi:hypothetical protein
MTELYKQSINQSNNTEPIINNQFISPIPRSVIHTDT